MHDIETSNMLLPMHNNTRPSHITTTRNHDDITRIKLDEIRDLALLKVVLDRVVDVDHGVGITDGAAVVGDDVGDAFGTYCYFADFEELVGGFFGCDTVDCETAFDVVEQTEVLPGFFDGDDIHEAAWVGFISPDFSVDLDQALLDDSGDFTAGQGVFQPVAKKDGER